MFWLYGLIATGMSVGLIFVGTIVIRRLATGGASGEKESLLSELEGLTVEIGRALERTADFCSKGQLQAVTGQLKEAQISLDAQKTLLKEVEGKLDEAQKTIEEKEAYHQSIKTAKSDDEEKLTTLLARFEDIAAESIALEQRIAASMKNVDQMMTELQLTQDQLLVLQDLQTALTDASSQLRELYIEYDGVKKRIDALNLQLEDLEGEYTKLVEQQLGE